MARTDAHEPYAVRALDPKRREAWHDHSTGDCDLPDIDLWVAGHAPKTRCTWALTRRDLFEHALCGCAMCRGHFTGPRERRTHRRGKRAAIQAQLDDYVWDDDDALVE